ncbi:MAG: Coenzyme F420 hydrogenase/dehydrogenase, beta subunit C-terminal domain [Clostridia bacterium]|nr:Coenzyme F420 hydrogenase/dehydrogenase, beta subunit C-terminal domain [Clostridia bacterium]
MLPVKDCTGCGACSHICPKNCINMVADNNGFLYPQINNDKCVNCSLCEKTCPVLNKHEQKSITSVNCYAAKVNNDGIRHNSSSGGVFSVIAEKVLKNNGIVYGAAFDENFVVKHIGISSIDDLDLLRRSKYVQSDLNNAFSLVESNLKEGKTVLFTGTPCQIEGLIAYLKKPYDNLTTVDFICHGVPAPDVWEEYKKQLKAKHKAEITKVNFRDKSLGWKNFSLRVEFHNGNVYCNTFKNDPYMKAFLINLDLRNSCYTCKFKNIIHKSDITVADFWGIDKIEPSIDDDKGLSLLLLNTDKGKVLITETENNLTLTEIDIEKTFPYNPCIIKPSVEHNFRQYFLNSYTKDDFGNVVDSCLKPSYITRLKRKALQIKNGDI